MIAGYLANNSIHTIDTQFCEASTNLGTKVEFGVAREVATSGALATTMRLVNSYSLQMDSGSYCVKLG